MPAEPNFLFERAVQVLERCRRAGVMVATAESCTGGLVAATITDVPGSSEVFDRGYVTYSNDAKHDLLGVPEELLRRHGAVSEPVARAMVEGVFGRLGADVAVAVTGIAGPDGGTAEKPVGLVHIAAGRKKDGEVSLVHKRFEFGAVGRDTIRWLSVEEAFNLIEAVL